MRLAEPLASLAYGFALLEAARYRACAPRLEAARYRACAPRLEAARYRACAPRLEAARYRACAPRLEAARYRACAPRLEAARYRACAPRLEAARYRACAPRLEAARYRACAPRLEAARYRACAPRTATTAPSAQSAAKFLMKIAFVFPGQGAQYAGMGRDVADKYPVARAVFNEVDTALDFPLSRLCFEGPEEDLKLTENTQPAILTTSVALYRVLEGKGIRPDFVAGHSLGEYSALVAAGGLKLSEAAPLVRRRGRYMQEAVPVGVGATAVLLGLDLETVK